MSEKPLHIWERFTQDSREFYIHTTQRLAAAPDAVFEPGAGEAATIIAEAEPYLPWRRIAVNVAFSVGRNALPTESEFNRSGLEIAPTMLDLLDENAQGRAFREIKWYVPRIAAELTRNGAAHLRFDTRPRAAHRLRALAPGAIRPGSSPRPTRRISRSPGVRRHLFDAHGHTVAKELRPDTDERISVATRREQRL